MQKILSLLILGLVSNAHSNELSRLFACYDLLESKSNGSDALLEKSHMIAILYKPEVQRGLYVYSRENSYFCFFQADLQLNANYQLTLKNTDVEDHVYLIGTQKSEGQPKLIYTNPQGITYERKNMECVLTIDQERNKLLLNILRERLLTVFDHYVTNHGERKTSKDATLISYLEVLRSCETLPLLKPVCDYQALRLQTLSEKK